MILWGMGMGAPGACLEAVLSAVVPFETRSTAFGVFDTGFGIAWFVASAIMGLLYEIYSGSSRLLSGFADRGATCSRACQDPATECQPEIGNVLREDQSSPFRLLAPTEVSNRIPRLNRGLRRALVSFIPCLHSVRVTANY
jgi:hypothetical protein